MHAAAGQGGGRGSGGGGGGGGASLYSAGSSGGSQGMDTLLVSWYCYCLNAIMIIHEYYRGERQFFGA